MSRFIAQFLRRFLREQVGQSAVVVAVTITAITAVAATSVEVGHVYYAYQKLVQSTNQAVLAGAQTMDNDILTATSLTAFTADVTSAVNQYSSIPGGANATSLLANDSIATQSMFCSSTMENLPYPSTVTCQAPQGGGTTYNAIKVTQTAVVNLWFGGLVGMKSMNLAATSTASMTGGSDIPFNLAVIMDTTNSMSQTIKNDKDCATSQISCAVAGLESMLEGLAPCQQNTTCTAGTPYVDDVALFVFPALSAAFSANNYNSDYCGAGAGTVPYNFIDVTPGSTQNLGMETTTSTPNTNAGAYEIIPFNDVYKTNDNTSNLAAGAALAEAVAYNGTCKGLSAPGGQGTYYAQVIYAAQAALEVQQAGNPNSENVMIILSDGDATASGNQIVADNNPTCAKTGGSCLNGTGTATTNPSGYHSPTYPSALGECGQAVQAAQLATAAGTAVYTIGFGSETSGCSTDQTYTITAGSTDGAESWPGGTYPKTPCNAIAAMASKQINFYSDNSGGCAALASANANFTSIASIFQQIGNRYKTPRLIPNGTP